MNTEQMEFALETPKPTAQILAFPLARDRVMVRQVAAQLQRRSGPQADRYFQTECRRLVARFTTAGIGYAEARAQVESFAQAVQDELIRTVYCERGRRPGGDAA